MKNWIKGIPYEEAFWRSLFRNKKARTGLMNWSKYGKDICLPGFDAPAFLKECESRESNPIVLDVGCGMSYCTGNMVDGKQINLHYIDPLASFYNKILDDYKVDLPKVEFGMIEYLSSFYPKSDVSLIMVQNALDHSSNPVKGIKECVRSLKIGGVLYLKHYINEAEYENYRGFHQYNVDEQDGKLILWNRAERHDVEELLKGVATVETKRIVASGKTFVVGVVTKTAEMPVATEENKKDIALLCSEILSAAEEMNRTSAMMKFHVKKKSFAVMQFFLRMLSQDVRMRLKMMVCKVKRDKSLAH